jgi:hypothetical protein
VAISDSDLDDLLDVIRSGGNIDVIRHGITILLQGLIDAELASSIGAAPFERTEARSNQRNWSRPSGPQSKSRHRPNLTRWPTGLAYFRGHDQDPRHRHRRCSSLVRRAAPSR